jgi:hypothetical protein
VTIDYIALAVVRKNKSVLNNKPETCIINIYKAVILDFCPSLIFASKAEPFMPGAPFNLREGS